MAQELEPGVHNESDLIEIATRLACEGYWQDIKQLMYVSRVFRYDEQLWDAMKDEPGAGKHKRTRLVYAARKGDLERVHFLLDRGAKVNGCCSHGTYPTRDDYSALMGACEMGRLKAVRALCEKSADVNFACTDGQTSLMFASQEGHLEVVRELCEMGAVVNAITSTCGVTALMLASQTNRLEVVRELCHRGADVSGVTTDDGKTVLMIASECGSLDVVRELCSRGADVNARALNGSTVLMMALLGFMVCPISLISPPFL